MEFLRARLYDPIVGRFISLDPLSLSGSYRGPVFAFGLFQENLYRNLVFLSFPLKYSNLYLYVDNEVPNITDPSGMQPCVALFGYCLAGANEEYYRCLWWTKPAP